MASQTSRHPSQLIPTVKKCESTSITKIKELLLQHTIPSNKYYKYGTAGFRYLFEEMIPIMVRIAIVAGLRAFIIKESMGIMITASHNSEKYNGVKLIDPNGYMMNVEGEEFATKWVNEGNIDQIIQLVESKLFMNNNTKNDKYDNEDDANNILKDIVIHIGHDTRWHSPQLVDLVVETLQAMGITVVNHGLTTTPMLHHVVLHSNSYYLPLYIPKRTTVYGYIEMLAHSYWQLIQTSNNNAGLASSSSISSSILLKRKWMIDCACGVGYSFVPILNDHIQYVSGGMANEFVAINGPLDGPLNEKCGSEFVQTQLKLPLLYDGRESKSCLSYDSVSFGASLDGDSDRLVIYSCDELKKFMLFDGDAMSVLISSFILEQMLILEGLGKAEGIVLPKLSLGVVQTAYANGASTDYLRNRLGKENVLCAKTGMKHIQAMALKFDIGVYFEANGHGTVYCDGTKLAQYLSGCSAKMKRNVSYQRLLLVPCLISSTIGDSIADLLLIDGILCINGWESLDVWQTKHYKNKPCRQIKVEVKDRSVIKNNENETKCVAPDGLQAELNELMNMVIEGRCFVRPSGTEPVVRVYAEGKTMDDVNWLISKSAEVVLKYCGKLG